MFLIFSVTTFLSMFLIVKPNLAFNLAFNEAGTRNAKPCAKPVSTMHEIGKFCKLFRGTVRK